MQEGFAVISGSIESDDNVKYITDIYEIYKVIPELYSSRITFPIQKSQKNFRRFATGIKSLSDSLMSKASTHS